MQPPSVVVGSARALGRKLGMAHTSILDAVKAGRIGRLPSGVFDVEACRAGLTATSKRSRTTAKTDKPRLNVRVQGRPSESSRIENRAVADPALVELAAVRLRMEQAQLEEREVRLAKLKGSLIDKSGALAHVYLLARRERDSFQGWPPRIAAQMASELQVDPHLMLTVLNREVANHLRSMAEIAVKL